MILYTLLLLLCLTCQVRGDCASPDKVYLQLNWVWQAQFAGFQAASYKGYYADECLLVQIRQGESTFNGISEVESGAAMFGNAWTSGVAVEQSNGNDLTVIMQHFRKSGLRLVSKVRPDIQSFTDLENKTVSVFKINQIDVAVKAAFTKFNVQNVHMPTQALTPFQLFATDGTAVDAVSALVYNELAQLYEQINPDTGQLYRPEDLKVFDINDLGTAMLEDNVFVKRSWLDDGDANKDIARRFVKATAKGWIYCRDHEDECRNMLYDHGSHQQWMMREVNRLIWPSPDGIGVMDDAALENTINILNTTGNLNSSGTSPLSDSSFMRQAIAELIDEGLDVYGTDWSKPQLHFCQNSGEATFHICDELEATVCEWGEQATAPGVCEKCTPGSYAALNGTGNSCKACPPGTFSTRDVDGLDPDAYLDEAGGIQCRGCPSGTKAGPGGRVICGRAGFEDTLLELLNTHKPLVGAWAAAMGTAGLAYIYLRKTYPGADAGVFPQAMATLLETVLDGVFLSLLQTQHSTKYFAVALTGFTCHFVINAVLVGCFLHNEFRQSATRKWAERNHSYIAPIILLGVANPELLGILSSRIGAFKFTQAPFTRKGLEALRFSSFFSFLAGKLPQLTIEILLLQTEGWHLDPFLAAVTTMTLLVKGTIHYLVFNMLQLYRKRRGGMSSKGSQQGGSLEGVNGQSDKDGEMERVRTQLVLAKRRVRELEEVLREMEKGVEEAVVPVPVGAIRATSMDMDVKGQP